MAIPVPDPAAGPPRPVAQDQPGLQAGGAVRLVAGFAGFGAGSVNLAISSSIFSAATGPAAPPAVAAGLAAGAWGLMLLSGAVVFLAKDRLVGGPRARYVLAGAAAIHLAAMALPPAVGPGSGSGLRLTHLSALLLTLMILAALGWLQRARQHSEPPRVRAAARAGAGVRPGQLLLGAFAGAVLVAGITTPGLAASTAGQYAVPHGEHGNVAPGSHHQR